MTPQQLEAMNRALEALEQTLQTLDDENAKPGGAIADTIWHSEHETLFDYLGSEITAIKEVLAEHAMRATQRLGQEIEQEPVAHCEAGPNYCWKCLEESNPTYGSEEIKKLREVNKSLMKNIEELKKEPPPFWPVVQHLLDEYGLQFIDIVAAYRESTQPEQEPVAWRTYIGRGYYIIDPTFEDAQKNWPDKQHQPLYAAPPQRTEQEPVAVKHMKEWVEYLKRKSDHGQHMKIPSEMSAGACWELAIELEQFINTTPPQRKPRTYCQECMRPNPIDGTDCAHGIKESK